MLRLIMAGIIMPLGKRYKELFLAAGVTRKKERSHRESIIGGIREPFHSLVSESTVSVPLP
jgi:hypothetical protein